MLNGSDLTVATTAVLVGAICLGALLHWFWLWLGRGPAAEQAELDEMAARLHEADLSRENAEASLREAEAAAAQTAAEATERLAALERRYEDALDARETELQRDVAEARAELAAMRDGLGTARRRITELEAEIEALRS